MEFKLWFATDATEKTKAYRLRYELFVKEQHLFLDEADHENQWLTDEYDASGHILLAELDGEVVGSLRINLGKDAPFSASYRETYDTDRFRDVLSEKDMMIATRFLIRKDYRGSMLSFQMLWHMFEFAANQEVALILVNCEPHLINRYNKLGFRPYGGISNHPTSGLLVCTAVVTHDFEYMLKIKSPLTQALATMAPNSELKDRLVPLITADAAVMSQDFTDADAFIEKVNHSLKDVGEGLGHIFGHEADALVLIAKSHLLRCPPGASLIHKGHVSRTLYILLSGQLEVRDEGALVAVIDKPGALIGEVALFTDGERISDVITGPEGAQVLALNERNLKDLINDYGTIAAKFLHYVTQSLCYKLKERAAWSLKSSS